MFFDLKNELIKITREFGLSITYRVGQQLLKPRQSPDLKNYGQAYR
jgi:hypothetical protein